MCIGLYGISRSGKNFLIDSLVKRINQRQEKTLFHVNGSGTLDAISRRLFSLPLEETTEEQKEQLRSVFCDEVAGLNNGFRYSIVDGHYSFPVNDGFKVVFTSKDKDLYDILFYLDTPACEILEYANKDLVKKNVAFMTEEEINAWKNFEIDQLRHICNTQYKELIVLDNNTEDVLVFFERYLFVNTGIILDAKKTAQSIIAEHRDIISRYDNIILLDCDRTISNNDTTYDFCAYLDIDKGILKKIFAGERYSSYQFFQVAKVYAQQDHASYDNAGIHAARKAVLNYPLIDDIKKNGREYLSIGITSGVLKTWETIQAKLGFPQIIAGGSNVNTDEIIVSRAVKYQLARFLHAEGKYVIAVGDSAVDIDMLEEADKGFIVAQEKSSTGVAAYFKKTKSKIMQLTYNQHYYEWIATKGGIFL
jgi:phosphoserine phosphatase